MDKDYSTPKKIQDMIVYAESRIIAAPIYVQELEVLREVRKQWFFLQDRLKEFSEKHDKLQGEIIRIQDKSLEMLQAGGDPVELSAQLHDRKVELADVDGCIAELGVKLETLRPKRSRAESAWENSWFTVMRQEVHPKFQDEKNDYLEAASCLDSSWFHMARKLFRKMRLDGREEEDWPSKNVPSPISFPLKCDRSRTRYRQAGLGQ